MNDFSLGSFGIRPCLLPDLVVPCRISPVIETLAKRWQDYPVPVVGVPGSGWQSGRTEDGKSEFIPEKDASPEEDM